MPQCFQWNAAAIVDDAHWEDTPLLTLHPLAGSTIQCAALYLGGHASVFIVCDPVTANRGQDNEKDDTEVIS